MKLPHIRGKDLRIILPIALVGLFLRLFHLRQLVGFDFDQEYAAMFAQNVLTVFPIQMIGQGLSVPGLFMGPFYFYYLVPFFALSRLDPIGGYIGSIALGIFSLVLSFFILKHIFDKTTAIVGSLLLATLVLYIQYDWAMAPTYSSIGLIILTWLCMFKYWMGHMKYLPLLAFIFGLYTSFHPILFPFYFVFLLLLGIKRKMPSIPLFLISWVCFVLPITPLLMFEYFRHFLEVKALFTLGQSSKGEVKNLQTLIEYGLILFRFPVLVTGLPLKGLAATVFSLVTYGGMAWLAFKRKSFWKNSFHITILVSSVGIFLLYYYMLPTHVPEYYFIGVETILFIYMIASIGYVLTTHLKIVARILLILILLTNVITLITKWRTPSSASLADKSYILRAIEQREKTATDYDIRYNIDPGQDYGLGYLTRLYNLHPNGGSRIYEIVLPISRTHEKIDIYSPSKSIGVILHK